MLLSIGETGPDSGPLRVHRCERQRYIRKPVEKEVEEYQYRVGFLQGRLISEKNISKMLSQSLISYCAAALVLAGISGKKPLIALGKNKV